MENVVNFIKEKDGTDVVNALKTISKYGKKATLVIGFTVKFIDEGLKVADKLKS